MLLGGAGFKELERGAGGDGATRPGDTGLTSGAGDEGARWIREDGREGGRKLGGDKR
jgi:hypothetical protein